MKKDLKDSDPLIHNFDELFGDGRSSFKDVYGNELQKFSTTLEIIEGV